MAESAESVTGVQGIVEEVNWWLDTWQGNLLLGALVVIALAILLAVYCFWTKHLETLRYASACVGL
jgi:hypothetical protein